MLTRIPLNIISIKNIVKREYPSAAIFAFAESSTPDQSKLSSQPKKIFVQPSGVTLFSISGDTFAIAMIPTAKEPNVMIVNCRISVNTTLNMPPLTT